MAAGADTVDLEAGAVCPKCEETRRRSAGLLEYAQAVASDRFDRGELRSSEREALAATVAASTTGALAQCRSIVDSAAARGVDDFLAAHPEARTALAAE